MHTSGSMPADSAATSSRSTRPGLGSGRAALVTIITWSTLATITWRRPRLERASSLRRGSMEWMVASWDDSAASAAVAGRTVTRSPATTGCRSRIDIVRSTRRVVQRITAPSSSRRTKFSRP